MNAFYSAIMKAKSDRNDPVKSEEENEPWTVERRILKKKAAEKKKKKKRIRSTEQIIMHGRRKGSCVAEGECEEKKDQVIKDAPDHSVL